MISSESSSNNIDEWISGLQEKPSAISTPSTPTYHEGSIIRDLIFECSQERQKIQWNKILENAQRDGLLTNYPMPTNSEIHSTIPKKLRQLTASNQSWILWVASIAIIGTSIYVLLPTINHELPHNGLANTMGGGATKQLIYIENGQTPKSIAEKIELLFKNHQVGYQRVNTSDGRVQFIARIPENSPVRKELEKLGIPPSALSEYEEFSDFVLISKK